MDTICLQCGDKGWDNSFVYCVKCLDFVVHRYCLNLLPKTYDEYVRWLCDDCEVKEQNKCKALNQHVIPCQTVDPDISENFERVLENVEGDSGIEEKTSNLVVTKAQVSEDCPGKSYNRVSGIEANKSSMVLNLLPYQMGENHDISENVERVQEIKENTNNMVVITVQVSEEGPESNRVSEIEANKNQMMLNVFLCQRGDEEISKDIKGVSEIEEKKNDKLVIMAKKSEDISEQSYDSLTYDESASTLSPKEFGEVTDKHVIITEADEMNICSKRISSEPLKKENAIGKKKGNKKLKFKDKMIDKKKGNKKNKKGSKKFKGSCFHCNEPGHWKRNCRRYLAELKEMRKDEMQRKYDLPFPGYDSPVLGYNLPVPRYDLPVHRYDLPDPGYDLPVRGYNLPVRGYDLPVPGYDLPVRGYDFPAPWVVNSRSKNNHVCYP